MARRATAIEDIRKENPNVLLLDAGGSLTGQSLADATQGQVIVEAMNRLGYTAMAIGERELYLGVAELTRRMQEARFPFVSANVIVKATGKLLAEPYTIVEVGGIKVGILGLTNTNALQTKAMNTSTGATWSDRSAEVVITDPLAAAQKYVPELAAKADMVIVLSHTGMDIDQRLAEQVPGIAVIVGGYTRRLLSPPLTVQDTLIVQAGYDGEWLGRLDVQLDGMGKVARYEGTIISLGPDYKDDPQMAQWLNQVKKP